MKTQKQFATATFQDIYAGAQTIALVGFPTKRNGVRVTRYRWIGISYPSAYPGYLPFASIERAVHAAQRDARITDVRTTDEGSTNGN